ncbi:hypothetical protein N657DRAFT_644401 [Parathielavia appendiculata]|uniref:Uncharacterized protein n=1 Tax=Parathielavia appendiculata TaxID=2587402 RepID=A0AAN6U0P2_9PEZI|nr:hypothetical protein N657DRAFT_644401 [Parathielavia appendiculata]
MQSVHENGLADENLTSVPPAFVITYNFASGTRPQGNQYSSNPVGFISAEIRYLRFSFHLTFYFI